jgi:Ig-like domain from next to BRCA1 gene
MALEVHPLRLLQLVFEDYPLPLKLDRIHDRRGDKSIFLEDVTIADGTTVLAGSRFTKTWRVQNVGTATWSGRTLRCEDEELVVMRRNGEKIRITEPLKPVSQTVPVPYTEPGGIVELSVDFIAPRLPGTCISYWKSYYPDGTVCLPKSVGLTCKVRVVSMTATGDDLALCAGEG